MKKNYIAPQICVAEIETENLLGNTSYIDVDGDSHGIPKSPRRSAADASVFDGEDSNW